MSVFTEWLGSRALTPLQSHWFAPASSTYDGTTDYFADYTETYGGGSPYNVTLTDTRVDFFGNIIADTSPIASYNTGPLFSLVGDEVAPSNEGVFFTVATPGAAAGTVDLDVQRYDGAGDPIDSPATLVSGIAGFQQLSVASAASFGQSYTVAYSTFDAAANAEKINLLSYDTSNRLTGTETLSSFSTGNGYYDPFGFGTLDSSPAAPSFIVLTGYLQNGNFGVSFQKVSTAGTPDGGALFVAPLYPTGSTSRILGSWTWTRLDAGSHDLVIAMPYSYTDTAGAHYGLDVRFLDTTTNAAADDTIALAQNSETHASLARMSDGSLVVGYTDNGVAYLRDYNPNGTLVGGTSFALPGGTGFNITSLGDGRVLVEYPQAQPGGDQLFYDIYDTRQSGVTLSSFGGGSTDLAGTVYNDLFLVNGAVRPDTIVGAGGTDFILTGAAAGTGTVVADLLDGTVTKGGQLDARFYGIRGVTLGADPSVVLGLAAGTDLVYGGTGALAVHNEGGTDDIRGSTASNVIVGGSGTTIFYGSGGTDTMLGGTGQNFMQSGPTATSADVFYGNGGTDFVYGGLGATDLVGGGGTEDLTGGSGYNQLVGSNQSASALNILNGGTGTDLFYAGVGTNLLEEGTGTDVLAGNAGTDYVYGGAGRSFVYGGTGTDVVTTGAGGQYVEVGGGTLFFNDTAANLHAGRFDQIDGFAGSRSTDLYLPTAVQGATRFVGQNGGTAIITTVAGGSAEVFVSNAAVAQVQSHTHFTL